MMTTSKFVNKDRRNFLKVSAAAGGGMLIGFSWLTGCKPESKALEMPLAEPEEWYRMNGFLRIGDTGLVTIISPNPEIGQNVKTSMPMIVAEELDVNWKDVVVEQGPLNTDLYERQVAGGSQSIRHGWEPLRNVGAAARHMLISAAAAKWTTRVDELSTNEGYVIHPDGSKLSYGELASDAALLEAPTEVKLKDSKDFKIIGKGKTNVDMNAIVTGKPLFGLDLKYEGMVHAVVKRPESFGQKLTSFDDEATREVNGVLDVIRFGDKLAIIGKNTWACIKGQRLLKAVYQDDEMLENSRNHSSDLMSYIDKKADEPKRNDGDVIETFAQADRVITRSYEAPFLPHNPLEPMNFFANVTDEKVELIGPTQTPQWQRSNVSKQLGRDESEISIHLTRMGGGFGRRLYGNFVEEAVAISDKIRKPVKLIYTREDDFESGPYRPASAYKFSVAIKNNEISGYHLIGAGFNMRNACRENNFPAGTLPNYRVDAHNLETNIPTGAWRAPITNFLAFAEQAFLDEVARDLGKDAIEMRLTLLQKAKNNTVGEIDYEIDKMIGVIELARNKSGWGDESKHLGFSVYYSHNSYVAEVAEVKKVDGELRVVHVTCAVDCGIVVNPIGAINQIEGGIIDGIGHAMYGDFSFENGAPEQNNFNQYRMIRMAESPSIDVHFVESTNPPTGLGEPTLPPAGGAVANAIFSATKRRLYKQPFVKDMELLG